MYGMHRHGSLCVKGQRVDCLRQSITKTKSQQFFLTLEVEVVTSTTTTAAVIVGTTTPPPPSSSSPSSYF